MEIYKFFNSAAGDTRTYQADDFASYFGSVLTTGLLHNDKVPGLAVTVETGTLNTTVSAGKAIMEGHLYENSTPLTLAHSIPDTALNRIDRVVLRLDLRNEARFIKLFVKEGEPLATPIAPVLQRDSFVYELSLAQILVRANTAQLLQSDLTDERLDPTLAGLTYSLISGAWGDLTGNDVRIYDTENLFGSEILEDILTEIGTDFAAHDADNARHLIESDISRIIEKTSFKTIKSGKDANGIYTTIEHRRKTDNTLVRRSVLSGGSSPQYATRTITYYAANGSTVLKTDPFTLSYDGGGDLISEV